MFAMCMPSDEVIFKSDMQGDKIYAARTSRNPLQSVVVLSVNTTFPAILEGPKDSIRETKHNFNTAKNFEEWMPIVMVGGTCKNLTSGVVRAFDRIKGAISLTLGAHLAKSVMMELQEEFLMHFRAIFTMEVTNYYQEILGKTGGVPPHTFEVKVMCWALVTKLLWVMFQEIHKVQMFAAELGNITDDPGQVNGLYLYPALEELRVLREFTSHDYHCHPKYNQCILMHLFDTLLPYSVYEKRTDGAGHDMLHFTRSETALSKHKTSINQLDMAVGSICSHLNTPTPAA
jgi:hypothetical protein